MWQYSSTDLRAPSSKQACVIFRSHYILASMYCPLKNNKTVTWRSQPAPSKCQMSKCQPPLEYDLKNQKWRLKKSIIWGHHLPLSRDPIQPVQPLIINVSTGDRGKKPGRSLPGGQKPFSISVLPTVFVPNSISLSLLPFSSPRSLHVSSQFSSVQRVFISVTSPVVKCQLSERERYDGTSANRRNLSTAS